MLSNGKFSNTMISSLVPNRHCLCVGFEGVYLLSCSRMRKKQSSHYKVLYRLRSPGEKDPATKLWTPKFDCRSVQVGGPRTLKSFQYVEIFLFENVHSTWTAIRLETYRYRNALYW